MSTEINGVDTKQKIEVNAEKRAFMKKCGKYAAVGAGMATLMTPTLSTAGNYCKTRTRTRRRKTPDQNSVHTTTTNHGGNNHRDRNGH